MKNSVVLEDIQSIVHRLKNHLHYLEGHTVLISGGAGFIGSYLLHTLSYCNFNTFKQPCKIISLDNYVTGTRKSLIGPLRDKNITFITCDVSKPFRLQRKIDFIIHAAGIASPVYYRQYPLEAIEVNTQGTKNLLEIGKKSKVKSFLYFSSSEIYGDPDPKFIPTPETYLGNVSSIGPRACYDESKRLGEALSVNYYRVFNLPVKIVRPFNIYGPGMKPQDYRVIPTFLTSALAKKFLPVHSTGKHTRTYCYVTDAIVAFIKVLLEGRDGEVYNVGNDKPEITTHQLAKVIAKLFPYKIHVKRIPYPDTYPQDVPNRRSPDLTKIRKDLGYLPKVDLETGLKRFLQWYQEISQKVRPY